MGAILLIVAPPDSPALNLYGIDMPAAERLGEYFWNFDVM